MERLIVGISGASGIIYGIKLLQMLKDLPIQTHLVVTKAAILTLRYETELTYKELLSLADVHYKIDDIAAPIASGSYKTMGMIIAPCSVCSFSQIASGGTSNLLTRAADVCLKERRKLVLMVREMPLHANHLKSLMELSQLGAIIAPPTPAFYMRPKTIDDMVHQTLTHVLKYFIDIPDAPTWSKPINKKENVGEVRKES